MERINCIVFKVNNSLYAIDAGNVLGIEKSPQLKTLPQTPAFLFGVMDFRGKLIPLVSIRSYFGVPTPPLNPTNDVIVLQADDGSGENRELAFLTDGVKVITMLDFDSANDVPFVIRSFSDSVRRMTMYNGSPVVFLDLVQILSDDQKEALRNFSCTAAKQEETESNPE